MPDSSINKKQKEQPINQAKPLANTKKPSLKKKPNPTISATQKNQRKITEMRKELENLNNQSKETILIKDAEGMLYCQHEHCDQPAVTDLFCRYHYLAQWPRLYNRKKLLKEDYLTQTIQKLADHFGEEALSFLIKDCKTNKSFDLAIKEMNLSSNNIEDAPLPKDDD